jgi:hypothetical protein
VTTPVVFALFGFGLGALLIAGSRSDSRESRRDPQRTLRDRAIEAQKISAEASQLARDLAARWSEQQHAVALVTKENH